MAESKKKKVTKKSDTKSKSKVTKKKTKRTYTRRYYYLFKMNTLILNAFSFLLIIVCCLFFYALYGKESINVIQENVNIVMILYLPYLILHEQLHSLGYVIYGADFKNITFGAHLEKGVLCCLCKQRINKRNIIHSLLYPFVIIGIFTLIIGILVDYPVLVILSLANISGCSGDLLMYYHLSKLDEFEFSEYDDPIAFGLYTKKDFSKLKMFGLDYIDKKSRLEIKELRKIIVSKPSIILLLLFYALMIFILFI